MSPNLINLELFSSGLDGGLAVLWMTTQMSELLIRDIPIGSLGVQRQPTQH